MRYTNQYKNVGYMYTVYGSGAPDDYILVATVPAVGMYDIAMRLTPAEVALLRKNEDEFTQLVTRFVRGRELREYKTRRMERQISNVSIDEIDVKEG